MVQVRIGGESFVVFETMTYLCVVGIVCSHLISLMVVCLWRGLAGLFNTLSVTVWLADYIMRSRCWSRQTFRSHLDVLTGSGSHRVSQQVNIGFSAHLGGTTHLVRVPEAGRPWSLTSTRPVIFFVSVSHSIRRTDNACCMGSGTLCRELAVEVLCSNGHEVRKQALRTLQGPML